MAKAHRALSPAQIERRKITQARQKLWDRIWLVLIVAALVAVVGFNIYTQIIHHP